MQLSRADRAYLDLRKHDGIVCSPSGIRRCSFCRMSLRPGLQGMQRSSKAIHGCACIAQPACQPSSCKLARGAAEMDVIVACKMARALGGWERLHTCSAAAQAGQSALFCDLHITHAAASMI